MVLIVHVNTTGRTIFTSIAHSEQAVTQLRDSFDSLNLPFGLLCYAIFNGYYSRRENRLLIQNSVPMFRFDIPITQRNDTRVNPFRFENHAYGLNPFDIIMILSLLKNLSWVHCLISRTILSRYGRDHDVFFFKKVLNHSNPPFNFQQQSVRCALKRLHESPFTRRACHVGRRPGIGQARLAAWGNIGACWGLLWVQIWDDGAGDDRYADRWTFKFFNHTTKAVRDDN